MRFLILNTTPDLKYIALSLLLTLFIIPAKAQSVYTMHEQNQTPHYAQVINTYKQLAAHSSKAKLIKYGQTDSGKPLYAFIISASGEFNPVTLRKQGKIIFMINNGIHPGEPTGVNASLIWAHRLLNNASKKSQRYLAQVVPVIIPLYNIGGALNRNCCTRTNQNGPKMYGFRGNARNLDLDRDFIKMDARNTFALANIFHIWQPDIFVDNHTTDGADYQYPMTLIATQHDKLQPVLGQLLTQRMLPFLYHYMEKSGHNMTPYVESFKSIPDSGIVGFMDTPRYSSGYAALFNSLSFISEAHMLKPFRERVESTLRLLKGIFIYAARHAGKIKDARQRAIEATRRQQKFAIHWQLDSTRSVQILFKGYAAKHKKSKITGAPRLYYDEDQPYTKSIPYFNHYSAADTLQKPVYYIIPQGWHQTISRLQANGVQMSRIQQDTVLRTQTYYINHYKTVDHPYEGHYLHHNTTLTKKNVTRHFYRGDYIVKTNQAANRYIIEVLEPKSVDSFFNWNFYDSILQRKEYFSPYAFEDEAWNILKQDDQLRNAFNQKKATDPDFAHHPHQQLTFIYQHSVHAEPTYRRYPVARITHELNPDYSQRPLHYP